jgi:cytochrome c553
MDEKIKRSLVTAAALLSGMLAMPLFPAFADDVVEYGAYLSGECVTCHRAGNSDGRIPSLAGRSRDDILTALAAFKSGERSSHVMQDIAVRLADDEMLALAAYFSSLAPSQECRESQSPQEKHC